MTVTISNSISLDGYISGPNHYEDWISEADEKFFFAECSASDVIVMGSNTYDGNDGLFPVVEKEHVVFTSTAKSRTSEKFITFTDQDPIEFAKERQGEKVLVAGGGKLNATFLKSGIVTDISVCVHPVILGSGVRQFEDVDFSNLTTLKKMSEEDIGDGVVKIHYKVLN